MRTMATEGSTDEEGDGDAAACHGIELPGIELGAYDLGFVLSGEGPQDQEHGKAAGHDGQLKGCHILCIDKMSAGEDQLHVVEDGARADNEQGRILDDDKQAFKLMIAVGETLGLRAVEERDQDHERSDENKIHAVEDTIHEDCVRARDKERDELRGDKGEGSEHGKAHGFSFDEHLSLVDFRHTPSVRPRIKNSFRASV